MPSDAEKFAELVKDIPIAMMTTYGDDGPRSLPMAREDIDAGSELWFITARDTRHVRDVRQEPRVSLTFSSRESWMAASGRASVVDDRAKLEELWNHFAEAWLPGGPDDPNATLLRVDVDEVEYWDTPGGKVASLLSFAKVKLTGDTYDAEHGTVSP